MSKTERRAIASETLEESPFLCFFLWIRGLKCFLNIGVPFFMECASVARAELALSLAEVKLRPVASFACQRQSGSFTAFRYRTPKIWNISLNLIYKDTQSEKPRFFAHFEFFNTSYGTALNSANRTPWDRERSLNVVR